LPAHIVPLASAHSIGKRFYLQPVVEEAPILDLQPAVARIGDGDAEVSYALALPGMLYETLQQDWNCHQNLEEEKKKPFLYFK
jgi:hypothetical protein